MKSLLVSAAICCVLCGAGRAQERPKIIGVAHISIFVHDIARSREFYKDFLGFGEPFQLDKPDGSLSLTFIKINDRQYIELVPETKPGTDRLGHISIEVENAEAMRLYLKAHGIKVPDAVPKGRIGNSNFNVKDPDGHQVEIVQYEPGGWTRRENGRFMDGPRVSKRMMHLGITVASLDASMSFYRDLLGFQEIWRGSKDGKVLSWVNMKLPDSDDYIEFMLEKPKSPAALGTAHHIALETPDIEKSRAELAARADQAHYTRPLEVRTGTNRKRQLNLYDPDGTRTEMMEPKTVDGVPAPSSTAEPPK